MKAPSFYTYEATVIACDVNTCLILFPVFPTVFQPLLYSKENTFYTMNLCAQIKASWNMPLFNMGYTLVLALLVYFIFKSLELNKLTS